jgi:tetratricopeptide (TPR) repeat protein
VEDVKRFAAAVEASASPDSAEAKQANFASLVLEARIKSMMGDQYLDEVIRLLDEARKIKPDGSDAYDGLADAYLRKNDIPKMGEMLAEYLKTEKRNREKRIMAYAALSQIALQKGDTGGALDWIAQGLKEKPDDENLKKREAEIKAAMEAAKNPPRHSAIEPLGPSAEEPKPPAPQEPPKPDEKK